MTAERPGAIPAGDARRLRRALGVPPRRPGRGGRVRRAGGARARRPTRSARRRLDRLEAQLAVVPLPVGPASDGGPAPIGVLPAVVAGRDPAAGTRSTRTATSSSSSASTSSRSAPAVLAVPDGEHVLVAGPARSGRSTALARLATSWRERPSRRGRARRRPGAPVAAGVVAGGRRRGGGRRCRRQVSGRATVPARRRRRRARRRPARRAGRAHRRATPGLLVLAAGRPDALRAPTATGRRSSGAAGSAC